MPDKIVATSSLYHTSTFSELIRKELSRSCIVLCIAETGLQLDPVEYEALVQLIIYCSSFKVGIINRITINTFSIYKNMPSLW